MHTAADNAIARAAAARAAGNAPPTDTERIIAIPRSTPLDMLPDRGAAMVRRWTSYLALRADAPPLRPLQAYALDTLARNVATGTPRGLFAPIGVGHGKTLVTLLAGEVAQAQRPILMTYPAMIPQLQRDLAQWGTFYRFKAPTIMPYSALSAAKATDFLTYFRPDMLIADECHALRHKTSARTKRVFRYFRERPDTRFVALSGTMTGDALSDHAHLAELALREFAPMPLSDDILDLWESVINADGIPSGKAFDAVWPLTQHFGDRAPRDWYGLDDETRVTLTRSAYRVRLASTPGVVTSTEASVGSTLYLVARDIAVPPSVAATMDGLDTTWALPDAEGRAGQGEEIADALTMARAGSQISAGFYYVWDWPRGLPDVDWLDARRAWHRAVRGALHHSRDGYDSPLLVANAAARGEGSDEVLHAWRGWIPHKGKRPPPVRAVWVDRYMVRDAVAWARSRGRPVLLWYWSRAVEHALAAEGVPVYGMGSDVPDVRRTPVAALSINVHGKGKNLQDWAEMLVMECPSSGIVWEQLIGRIHRQGQRSPCVVVHVNQHTGRLRGAVEAAKRDAAYIEGTQGVAQRLNFGVWTTAEAATKALSDT